MLMSPRLWRALLAMHKEDPEGAELFVTDPDFRREVCIAMGKIEQQRAHLLDSVIEQTGDLLTDVINETVTMEGTNDGPGY
jgi:hypothetical protein